MADAVAKKPRPKNLDLSTIRLPVPGFVSILHRISGAGLFLMPPETYETFRAVTSNFLFKVLLLGLIWAYMHHFFAGIRFLLLDFHIGLDLESARSSAKIVLAVSIPASLLLWGVVVW